MCTTTSHYETHISTECSVGGSAQCDGFCVEDYNVVESFDHDETELDLSDVWKQAEARARVLAYGTTKRFAAHAGQGRVVVVERY